MQKEKALDEQDEIVWLQVINSVQKGAKRKARKNFDQIKESCGIIHPKNIAIEHRSLMRQGDLIFLVKKPPPPFWGKQKKSGKIDLHGLTHEGAYKLLQSFIPAMHESGLPEIVIITGKGSGTAANTLRRLTPLWLGTSLFAPYVKSWRHALDCCGGEGALYVKLKKDKN